MAGAPAAVRPPDVRLDARPPHLRERCSGGVVLHRPRLVEREDSLLNLLRGEALDIRERADGIRDVLQRVLGEGRHSVPIRCALPNGSAGVAGLWLSSLTVAHSGPISHNERNPRGSRTPPGFFALNGGRYWT